MFDKGQKLGSYPIQDIISEKEDWGRYRSVDPFFNRPVFLHVYSLTGRSQKQKEAVRSYLEKVFVLEHPALVPVFDHGNEGDSYFFTTSFYSRRLFDPDYAGDLSRKEKLNCFIDLAQALEYAQEHDLYPGPICRDDLVVDDKGGFAFLGFASLPCDEQLDGESAGSAFELSIESFAKLFRDFLSLEDIYIESCDSASGVISRCLNDKERFSSFSALVTALEGLVDGSGTNALQIQVVDQDVLSGELQNQRSQILPHLRELISTKKQVEGELSEAREACLVSQQALAAARREIDHLNHRIQTITGFDSRYERRKTAVSVFCGLVVGVIAVSACAFFMFGSHKPVAEQRISAKPPALIEVREKPLTAAVSVNREEPQVRKNGGEKQVPAGDEDDGGKAVNIFQPATAQAAAMGQANLSANDKIAVIDALVSWSEHWARQETDMYFGCYSDGFQSRDGDSFELWKKQRRERISRSDWIEVGLSRYEITALSARRVQVRFDQHYRSDRYEDRTRKLVTLANEAGRWRIIGEGVLVTE